MVNYEFLNSLMTNPDLAEAIRRLQGGAPPEAVMPEPPPPSQSPAEPGPPSVARTQLAPPEFAPGSPLGSIMDMQPQRPNPPIPREYPGSTEPGDPTLLVGDRPANHLPDEPQQPHGFKGFLKNVLPRMLASGIAAGATPSRYGGGGMDILAGMQAGGQELERRDRIAYDMNRQRANDETFRMDKRAEAEKRMSDIKLNESAGRMHDAQTDWYKAQAGAKAAVDPKRDLYERFIKETDPAQKEVLRKLWLQSEGHPDNEKVWINGKLPGTVLNRETGEVREVDAAKARAGRSDEMREHFNIDPTLWPYRQKKLFETHPGLEDYILYGTKGKQPAAERNPTEWSIAMDAAKADPRVIANPALLPKVALEYGNAARPVDPSIAEARRDRAELARANQFKKIEDDRSKDLNDANAWAEQATRLLPKDALMNIVNEPVERARIQRELKRRLQQAYDKYASATRRATGDPNSAKDVVVLDNGEAVFKDALPPASSAPPAPGTGGTGGGGGSAAAASASSGGRGGGVAAMQHTPQPRVIPIPSIAPTAPTIAPPTAGVPKPIGASPHSDPIKEKKMALFALEEFAKTNKMTPQQARTLLESQGWRIE
jgi:hypothetical protein